MPCPNSNWFASNQRKMNLSMTKIYHHTEDFLYRKLKVSVREHTINTSNSSIARNGASVISWSARAKHNVEKDRSPPVQTSRSKYSQFYTFQSSFSSVNLSVVDLEVNVNYQMQVYIPANVLCTFTIWITDLASYIHSLTILIGLDTKTMNLTQYSREKNAWITCLSLFAEFIVKARYLRR